MKKKITVVLVAFIAMITILEIPSSSFIIRVNQVLGDIGVLAQPAFGSPRHHYIVAKALTNLGGFSDERIIQLMVSAEEPDFPPRDPDWAHFSPFPTNLSTESFFLFGREFHRLGGTEFWNEIRNNRAGYRATAAKWAVEGTPDSIFSLIQLHTPIVSSTQICPPVLSRVGNNFHTVSDFYAHTNWVVYHPLEIAANLEAAHPPPGLAKEGEPGDSPSSPYYPRAERGAIESVKREWYLFEHDLFAAYPGGAIPALNGLGVSSQIKVASPRGAWDSWLIHRPAEGYVLGTYHKLSWYHTAIPHDTPVKITLVRDGVWFGDIVPEAAPLPVSSRELNWAFGNCLDASGNPKYATPDNLNARYQIRIVALEGAPYENISKSFFIHEPTYGAPANLIAKPYGWAMIQLTWTDGSNCENGFEVWRKKYGDPADYQKVKTLGPNITSTIDVVLPDTLYYYEVKAGFTNGTEAWTNEAESDVTSVAPEGSYTLSATYQWQYHRVKLEWDDPASNEQGFVVERRSDWEPEFVVVDGHVSPNVTTWYDTRTSNDTIYYYRVKVYIPTSFSYSPEAAVYVGAPAPVAR